MQNTVAVRISSFGQGRYEALLPAPEATVAAELGPRIRDRHPGLSCRPSTSNDKIHRPEAAAR